MTVIFDHATDDDVPAVVALLRDDVLGKGREATDLAPYRARLREIVSDPNNTLIVGRRQTEVVACYQLTIIPGFTLNATRRAEIEGVRVATAVRGQRIGAALLADAEARARVAGATLVQLTMNRQRQETHGFYAAHGFAPSHIGFKKVLC